MSEQAPGGEALPPEPQPQRSSPLAVAAATGLVLLALFWVGNLVWALLSAAPEGGISALRVAAWIGLGSGPLALIAAVAVLVLRSGRAEASRYARASARLRADSRSLAATLTVVTERIEAARASLGEQAAQLAQFGGETSERMARAASEIGSHADGFSRTAAALDDATAVARADLAVMLADLPRAETVVRALAEALRQGSSEADVHARTLGERLADLDRHARSASESTGGAAARLAGQLERIEASAAAADKRIEDVALALGRSVDAALEATAEGIEDTRRGVAEQSNALTALVRQGHLALGTAGDEAIARLSARLDELAAKVDGLGTGLRGQEEAARGLLGQLDQSLGQVEAKLAALGDVGAEHTADLAEAIVALAGHADAVGRTLGQHSQSAETVLGRVTQLRAHVDASSSALVDQIPAALARLRLHAEHSLQAITAAKGESEALDAAAGAILGRLEEANTMLARQKTMLAEAKSLGDGQLTELTERTAALEGLLRQAQAEVHALAQGATGELIEALLRVRDTASQASDHARDAISAAIPRAAQRLSESAARALGTALAEAGREELAAVGQASERAVEAARLAAERLSRHLVTIAETTTAIEARIEENRHETEAHDEASFARAFGLLIEALNSASIDVVRLLTSEVSDEDWKAYLRGDRGVFTRRAVRLLDKAELGMIAQRYNDETEFRDLVNRYVHDFEALLRRVMSTREGEAIATTMLSSDAGKLYVALAQSIERLRR